jgi:hypothetical protein
MVLYTRPAHGSAHRESEAPAAPQTPSHALLALLFALALGFALVPVFTTEVLPLLDWPNHMARMHVLRDFRDSSLLQQYYAVRWRPIPDLAMDLLVPTLGQVMPLNWAGRIFIGLIFLLLVSGTALVHRLLFGRFSYWPLLAFLFLYDRIFLAGFVNYLFGVGLGLVAFALWLALARRPVAVRILLSSVASLALYLSHLFSFGVYGLTVAGLELGRLAQARTPDERLAALKNLPVAAAQAVLPVILFFAEPHDPTSNHVGFGRFVRKADLLFSVFDNYDRLFDIACFVALLLLFLYGWRRGYIRFAPAMHGPLIALVIAYFAMPSSALTATNLDHRLPIAFALLLVASAAPRGLSRAATRSLAIGIAALFLVRMAIIENHWQASDRYYASLMPAFEPMKQGARIAVAYRARTLNTPPSGQPIAHFATMAVGLKDAFVPSLFASPSQQPVQFTHNFKPLANDANPMDLWREFVEQPGTATGERVAMLKSEFDYMLFVDHDDFTMTPPDWLQPVLLRPEFQLYRVTTRTSR